MIRIVTDSTAEFTQEEAKRYGIDVVPLFVSANGKTYLDRIDITPNEFFEMLKHTLPKTSQPNPQMFADVFSKYPNDEIICLSVSSKISGTIGSAQLGAREAGVKKIAIIDTLHTVTTLKIIVLEAIRLRDEGKSFDEIVSEVDNLIKKARILIGIETLEYLQKGGRISAIKAITGSLIQLKPILTFTDGLITPVKNVRGMKASINYIAESVLAEDIDGSKPVLLAYSYDPTNANTLKEKLVEGGVNIDEVVEFGPVVGTYSGFNAVVISYFVK